MLKHATIEKNALLMLILIAITVAIGGIVQMVPLFTIESTVEKVEGMRPYSPLELRGRDIYIREGCYNCHSQQVRPFRNEIERYGHYSIAAESMYDHPFQWGSKRTGPDLARVGGKYSNEWHTSHMINPRSVVPESIMPAYPHLAERPLEFQDVADRMYAVAVAQGLSGPVAGERIGPDGQIEPLYTKEMLENAIADLRAQVDPMADTEGLLQRYPKAVVADFDGNPAMLSEMDALIAYMQMLGTLVDFNEYTAQPMQDGAKGILQQ